MKKVLRNGHDATVLSWVMTITTLHKQAVKTGWRNEKQTIMMRDNSFF